MAIGQAGCTWRIGPARPSMLRWFLTSMLVYQESQNSGAPVKLAVLIALQMERVLRTGVFSTRLGTVTQPPLSQRAGECFIRLCSDGAGRLNRTIHLNEPKLTGLVVCLCSDWWYLSFTAQGNDEGAWRCRSDPQLWTWRWWHPRGGVCELARYVQRPEWAGYRQALKAANQPGGSAAGLASMEEDMLEAAVEVSGGPGMDGFNEHKIREEDNYERDGLVEFKVVLTIQRIAWPADGHRSVRGRSSFTIHTASGVTTTDVQCVWSKY
jgi:hypothetical protein